jgi:hypothetical protein
MSEIYSNNPDKPPKSRSKLGQWFMDLWTKLLKFLNTQFTGIFEKGKIFYTLIFFTGALIIAFFSLGKTSDGVRIAATIITITLVFGFLFLMVFTFVPALSRHLFDKEAMFTKILITVISFILSFIITLLWYLYGEDEITIPFLKFSQLLPYIFIVVFMGWNILQIHFIKDGVNSIAEKVEIRLISSQVDPKKKNIAAISLLVTSLLVPLLAHIFTAWVFWADAQALTSTDPTAPSKFVGWVVVIGIIFVGLDTWQVWLYIRSKKYDSVNVYSSFFYLLISLLIWFRSYGFITSFVSAIATPVTNFVNALGDILLVILTAVFVLRMFSNRIKKTKRFNENAIPFLVFALTIMYIAGQVVMILGSVGKPENQPYVNITNNSILLISSIAYFLWYSQFILQRKGYIKRNLYTIDEIHEVLTEFAVQIKENVPSESQKVDNTLKSLLDEHKIEDREII